jgi:hypothetical protein
MTSVKLKLKQFEPEPEIPKLSNHKYKSNQNKGILISEGIFTLFLKRMGEIIILNVLHFGLKSVG